MSKWYSSHLQLQDIREGDVFEELLTLDFLYFTFISCVIVRPSNRFTWMRLRAASSSARLIAPKISFAFPYLEFGENQVVIN